MTELESRRTGIKERESKRVTKRVKSLLLLYQRYHI